MLSGCSILILSAAKESVFYYQIAYSDSFAALRMTKVISEYVYLKIDFSVDKQS
jgi:hypothetical protein